MKLVTFNRAMRGLGNPQLIADEALIARLQAEGVVSSAQAWPPGARPQEVKPPLRSRLTKRGRELLGQTYLTK